MRHSQETRKKFLLATLEMTIIWQDIFGGGEFENLHYCDLLMGMWLKGDKLLTKTQVQQFMPRLGHQTAAKYINIAIAKGLIKEVENPDDSRSKLLTLPKKTVNHINKVLDKSIDAIKKVL